MSYRWSDWFVFVLTNIFAFFAIVGNAFVCYVIFKKKRNSTTFLLIASQAFSDLLYGLLRAAGFFLCSEWFANLNRFTLSLCEFDIVFFLSCFAVSSYSMMAIAIDRFLRLYFPHREKANARQISISIAIIWLISVGGCFLGLVGVKTRQYFATEHFVNCFWAFDELYKLPFFQQNYGYWAFTVLIFYIPMVTSCVMYTLVIQKVRKLRPVGQSSEDRLRRSQAQRENTIKMLFTILIVYYLLASPITFVTQVNVLRTGKHITCGKGNVFSLPFVFINMSLISTVINPFILCWFNATFKQEARRLFRWVAFDSGNQSREGTSANVTSTTAHSETKV